MTPLLAVRDLTVDYPLRSGAFGGPRRSLRALAEVNCTVAAGEALGVVGESGCGKSTLTRAILGLVKPSAGEIRWRGRVLDIGDRRAWAEMRREVQAIFQDPLDALDPRMTVGDSVAEPLVSLRPELGRAAIRARVAETLARVGLAPEHVNRYPHEFSGGQCQRIGIARGLVLGPRLLVCDEPVSALDVSIQAQIINLLAELRREQGLALLFVAHNLAVVRHVSDRIVVLYLGRVVEVGPAAEVCLRPRHPYTRALIAAIPRLAPAAEPTSAAAPHGEPPSPLAPPSGCAYRGRCPLASEVCAEARPPLEEAADGHRVACHHWRAAQAGERP